MALKQLVKQIKEQTKWKNFKEKWDNNIPKRGTTSYSQYQHEAHKVSEEIQNLLN